MWARYRVCCCAWSLDERVSRASCDQIDARLILCNILQERFKPKYLLTYPTFQSCTWWGLDNIRGIHANIETHHQGNANCLHLKRRKKNCKDHTGLPWRLERSWFVLNIWFQRFQTYKYEPHISHYNQIYNWTNMSWNCTAYFLDAWVWALLF